MGEVVIWLVILIPVSSLLTGLGIFAIRREKPMWFWSGSTVKEEEISDVPAYNRANGIMWIAYSAIFWAATILGLWRTSAGGIVLLAGGALGTIALPITYSRIYRRYQREAQKKPRA